VADTQPSVLTGVFKKPFAEQVAFFRNKLGKLVPTSRWDDISKAAHDVSFMVAGAEKADLLADLAAAVDRAIAEGTGGAAFRRDFRDIVQRRGWHNWTGEGSQAGENWRTRVIYQTNMSTSYAAGRVAQLRQGGFKYWIYRHNDSVSHPRPLHQAWNGITRPANDPFWKTHGTPNGWGCRCYILGARSDAGARRLGGDPSKSLDPAWKKIDPKTGAPVGIDKGWDYLPGDTVSDAVIQRVKSLRAKFDTLPPPIATALMAEWIGSAAFARWYDNPSGNWPIVRIPSADAEAIGALKHVADLSAETAAKQVAAHPEITAAEYALAQHAVNAPDFKVKDTDQSMVYVKTEKAGGHVLIVKATKTGKGLFVTSFRRLSQKEARRDAEIKRLMRKGK